MQQRSKEWLEIRRNKVGSSDAPIIMGVSPHKTIQQLYDEKINGTQQPCNAAMQRGIDLEPVALELFNSVSGLNCQPDVVFPEQYPWMIASLDGYDPVTKAVLEIKCPGEKIFERLKNLDIPKEYEAQFQHILVATNSQMLHFMAYRGDNSYVICKVLRDEEYIKNLLEKEKQFWDALQDITVPLPLTGFPPIETDRWIELEAEWKALKEEEDALNTKMQKCKSALVDESNYSNRRGPSLILQKVRFPGRIDYKSIPELKTIDLNPYRKEDTYHWRVDTI